MKGLYTIPDEARRSGAEEFFETLLAGRAGLTVERIISHGHASPPGFWYEQDKDEWVVVLEGEAELEFYDGKRLRLLRGGHVLLPRGVRHRVLYTSTPCIWLAVFGEGLRAGGGGQE